MQTHPLPRRCVGDIRYGVISAGDSHRQNQQDYTGDNDALLRTVEIEPAVNFNNIQKVTVIMTGSSDTEQEEQ